MKIIWFNTSLLNSKNREYLKYKSLTNVCEDVLNYNRIYSHRYCVDRTGTYSPKLGLKFDITDYVMPQLIQSNLSLNDCIFKRCEEILNKNKKIILMYSGGLDSVCCLSGFIRNYGIDLCVKRITICANEQSIASNPVFYDMCIKDKFEIIDSTNSNIKLADKKYRDTIIVNGDPANLFDGCVVLDKIMRLNISLDNKNWKQEIKKNHEHLFNVLFDKAYEHLIDVVEMSASSRNYSIDNVFDFVWWYNNNLLYMTHSLNMLKNFGPLLNANKLGKEYWKNRFIPFFQTDDFTLWAYNTKHEVLENKMTVNDYKKNFKQYINETVDYNLINLGNAGFAHYLDTNVRQFTFLDENYIPIFSTFKK